MTLDQLRIFVVVAEHEHVTRASYALDMVQSAVSKAIAALEGEVEFRLFDRVGRNIHLTEIGAAFRDRAVILLDHADRLTAWASEFRPVRHDAFAFAPTATPGPAPTSCSGSSRSNPSRPENNRIEFDRRAFVAKRMTEPGPTKSDSSSHKPRRTSILRR